MKKSKKIAASVVLLIALSATAVSAEPSGGNPGMADEPKKSSSRDKPSLLSDELGKNSELAKHGIALDNRITQYYGGVVDGGIDEEDHYSGRWDLLANLDGGKAGLWDGLLLKMRVGANWRPIHHFQSGTILSPYTPATLSERDDESISITDLSAVQMFGRNIGVTFGKLDIVDWDFNSFAHGRGTDQFENSAFVFNPVQNYMPLTTIGAGVVGFYDDGTPLASFIVLDTHNVPTESGFDELWNDGSILTATGELPTNFGDLPGRHRLGVQVSTSDQIDFSQNPRLVIDADGEFETDSDAWSVTYNGEQFFVTDAADPKKGWGMFVRAGLSDSDNNIVEYFLSGGLGGTGIISGRPNDNFGVGVFYLSLSDLLTDSDALDDESGFEAFYGAALAPWIIMTTDLQYISGALESADEAFILSARLQIRI